MELKLSLRQIDKLSLIEEELKEQKYFNSGMYHIEFHKPISLRINRFKVKMVKEAKLKLFISNSGIFCYTNSARRRTGYPVYRAFGNSDIAFISEFDEEERKVDRNKKAQLLKNKIHPNLWENIQAQTNEEFAKEFVESSLNPVYFIKKIRSCSRKYVADAVKDAIENKKDYSYRQETDSPSGRTLTIEVKKGEDGKLRAWFSSEYYQCANGDYYIILNPKVAIFYERD